MTNLLKYKQLAVSNPEIDYFQRLIDIHWDDWIHIAEASGLYAKYKQLGYKESVSKCALDIYVMSLWLLGFQKHVPGTVPFYKACLDYYHQLGVALTYEYNSSTVKYPLKCISGVPLELYILDNWLEGLSK